MTDPRRVVITGMGAVTPLGLNTEETWKNLVAGRSGIRTISLFDASTFPVRIAGEVKQFDERACIRRDPALADASRSTLLAVQAAQEAYEDCGLTSRNTDPARLGIYFGAGDSGIDFGPFVEAVLASPGRGAEVVDKGRYLEVSRQKMHPRHELENEPFMTVTHLARRFRIRGPISSCLTACAASSQAIGEAGEWIRSGRADVVMSGGAHAMIYPLGVAGFALLTALSTRNDEPEAASRPFDKKRDGFILGEGAAVVMLEELSHARKRNAKIYGELVGYGSTADAFRLTDMDAEGRAACRAVEIALQKSGLLPADVDYINAHGTSTVVNDSIETLVIKKAMGERAYRIPVSSIKSMLGHMIAAAGAVELIACLLAMRDDVIPPTINYEFPDPACDLDYVPNTARKQKVDAAVSNSFGFGGQNICLAVRRFHE